jgi:hypothetical protein
MKFKTEEFEIEFPEVNVGSEEARIRRWFKENPNYAVLHLIVLGNKVVTITEATDYFCEILKREVDRAEVYRMMKRLVFKGLVGMIHIGDVLRSQHNNELHSLIKQKYLKFLDKIPEQFRRKFRNIFYFYPTPFGKKFAEWCGEVAKAKVKRL